MVCYWVCFVIVADFGSCCFELFVGICFLVVLLVCIGCVRFCWMLFCVFLLDGCVDFVGFGWIWLLSLSMLYLMPEVWFSGILTVYFILCCVSYCVCLAFCLWLVIVWVLCFLSWFCVFAWAGLHNLLVLFWCLFLLYVLNEIGLTGCYRSAFSVTFFVLMFGVY